MSFVRPVLNTWLRLTEKPFLQRATDVPAIRRSFEQKAKLYFRPPKHSVFSDVTLAGRASTRVRAPQSGQSGTTIFYVHGGAYMFGSPHTHKAMLARLCRNGGFEAVLPSYRLAPEHPFPAALEDVIAAYVAWRQNNENVVIGGDSAGGGLALALLAETARLGLAPPRGTFVLSPLADMTGSAPSLMSNSASDVILPSNRLAEVAQMYLSDADPADPRASPLFADFHGAPPVWITVSDTEILLDDSRRMAARLEEQGVSTQLKIEQNVPHAWPIFQTFLPEARATLSELALWITRLEGPAGGN